MVKCLLSICIFALSYANDIRWWDVNSNLGYISGAKFTMHNNVLFIWLRPYGVFCFNNKSQTWQSLGPNAAQTQNNFFYKDTLYSTGDFFKQKHDKSQSLDLGLWTDILKKYRIRTYRDTLTIFDINDDTLCYSFTVPSGGYCDAPLFFDGINLWFSLGEIVGDGSRCCGYGYFDTETKDIKIFTLDELEIKKSLKPYAVDDYSFPHVFSIFNNYLWIGTARFSDYGPEPPGEGIYMFDINKKLIKKRIHVGNDEGNPSVLDMSFTPNYLWVATPLGIYRLHRECYTWSCWKLDTCAIVADSILNILFSYDQTTKFHRKIPKGRIVRLVGQSGGGHESQTGEGSTVYPVLPLEGWIYDSTINNLHINTGDSINIKLFKLYSAPDTCSVLLADYQDSYPDVDFIKTIYCENQGNWHRIKFYHIWLPFEALIYRLRFFE